MANWSETRMAFKGEEEVLKSLMSDIESKMEDSFFKPDVPKELLNDGDTSISTKSAYSTIDIGSIDMEDGALVITGLGRWCSPHGFFTDKCLELGLDGMYQDAEPGCDFYHEITVKNGIVTNTESEYLCEGLVDFLGERRLYDDYSDIVSEMEGDRVRDELVEKLFTLGIDVEDCVEKEGMEK